MGHNHKEQQVLAKEVADAQNKVAVDGIYHHYKSVDKVYKVIGLGFLEANDELCVIYQAQYGEGLTFVRPLKVWLEVVEWEGNTVPRFSLLA